MGPARLVRGRVGATRALLVCAGVLGVGQAPLAANGCETLAGETVRWIVPNSPGGGYDAYSRLIQPFLEGELGATIRIENRPEAGGLVGATVIRDAAADGRTIGIVNASGLLAVAMDRTETPNPATDFTILGRVLSNRSILLTGRASGLDGLESLLRTAAERPLVFGVRDAGSASVLAVPVIASLLGVDYALVTGYVGNSARVLAALRGEVDLLVQNFDSVRPFLASGELRALLDVSGDRAADARGDDPLLAGVPRLPGPGAVAETRAAQTGRSVVQAAQLADALEAVVEAGRIVVAPAALPDGVRGCLAAALEAVLRSEALRAAAARANLSIEPADRVQAAATVRRAAAAITELAPVVRAAAENARQ